MLISLRRSLSFHPLRHSFTLHSAESILKSYFQERLTMDKNKQEDVFSSLVEEGVPLKDHRWLSLLGNIERNVEDYGLESKIRFITALANNQVKHSLYKTIFFTLLDRLDQLNIQQLSILLWSRIKIGNMRYEEAAKILSELEYRLTRGGTVDHDSVEIILSEDAKSPLGETTHPTGVVATPQSLYSVLWCMAEARIIDEPLLKLLRKKGVQANLNKFSFSLKCTLLSCFMKLNQRDKRIVLNLYRSIRSDYRKLERGQIRTLVTLTFNISELLLREDLVNPEEAMRDAASQMASDMRQFCCWLVETILILLEEDMNPKTAALLLNAFRKGKVFHRTLVKTMLSCIVNTIYECKIDDISMGLRFICSLPPEHRASVANEEAVLSERIWELHHALAGLSRKIIYQLVMDKLLKPSPEVAKAVGRGILQEQINSQKQRNSEMHD